MEDEIHIIPTNDIKSHVSSGFICHCQPTMEGGYIKHTSYDGREFFDFSLEDMLEWDFSDKLVITSVKQTDN